MQINTCIGLTKNIAFVETLIFFIESWLIYLEFENGMCSSLWKLIFLLFYFTTRCIKKQCVDSNLTDAIINESLLLTQ